MRTAKRLWLVVTSTCLAFSAMAAPIQTLDLKPFIGPSPLEPSKADWIVPHGHQVLDGTPFQIDGAILLFSSNAQQKGKPARTNINDIPVGRTFEKLHLLAAAQATAKDGTVIAKILLQYADGSSAPLEIRYGDQVRFWITPWHDAIAPLSGTNSQIAWRGQASTAAQTDSFLQLFHVTLDNPSPEKEVKTISLQSTRQSAALMVAAMSVGPAAAEPLPDTVPTPKSPFPDLRPRKGDRASGEGSIFTLSGKPVPNAIVRVVAARKFKTPDASSTTEAAGVGAKINTGSDGRFTLPPLPDNRLYRLQILAPGFAPAVYRGFDPKSDPIEIRLAAIRIATNAANILHARVVNSNGLPVALAMVEPDGVAEGDGRSWGGDQGFPNQLITDTNGEFTISRNKPFTQVQIRVSAPGYAPNNEWLDVTNKLNTIQLNEGCLLQGRVLKDGKPMAGLRVGVSGADRNSEIYKGHYETRTGADGVFHFQHLPANTSWQFYGLVNSFKPHGALPARLVMTGPPGQTNDLGDLPIVPGLSLSGSVRTRHGEPLPKDVKVGIGFEGPWDYNDVTANKTGHFSFTGLYSGQVEVNVQKRGWRVSLNNRSLDQWNPWELTGRLEKDKTDLVITIEPGKMDYNSMGGTGNGSLPTQDQAQQLPLEGSEPSGSSPLIFAGHVVDDKTGRPILRFKAIPGYQPPAFAIPPQKTTIQKLLEPLSKKNVRRFDLPFWLYRHADLVTNGSFSFDFRRLTSRPLVQIQADGYQPYTSEPVSINTTNLVIRLAQGHGPNGLVLLPNGQPADKASVVYAATQEQFHLTASNSFSTYGNKEAMKLTARDGQFSFSARPNGQTVFVAHAAGWAEKTIGDDPDNLKLRLQPWATVTGILVNTNGSPAAGIDLCLTAFEDWNHGAPLINLQINSTTDAQGHFKFTGAPPRRLEIQRLILSGGRFRGMTYQLQTWLIAEPGIANDVGKITLDTPPPPTALEKLKQKLGL